MSLTIADMRRIFYGTGPTGESLTDSEIDFLEAANAAGVSAYDIIDVIVNGGTTTAADVSVDTAAFLVANGDDAQEVLAELDAAIDSGLSGGLAAVSTTDSAELDFSGNGTAGTPLSATIIGVSADKVADGAVNHAFTAADDTKLGGIAVGATANSPDATLLNRANHTGSQAIGTITGLQAAIDGKADVSEPIAAAHIADAIDAHDGSAISVNTAGFTNAVGDDVQEVLGELDAAIGAGGIASVSTTDSAEIDFSGLGTVGSPLTADLKNGISADRLVDGAANHVFTTADDTKLGGIAAGATANATDAQLRDRTTHTGVQAIATITGLQTALDAKRALEWSLNSQVASYQLVAADAAKVVKISNAAANNLTVPANATVAFPVGTEIWVVQEGAGATTIVAAGGVTLRSLDGNLVLAGQYSFAKLIKIATNEWLVEITGVRAGPRELTRAVTVTAQTGITTVTDMNSLSINFTVDKYPVEVELLMAYAYSSTGPVNGTVQIYDTPGAAIKQYGLISMYASGAYTPACIIKERITAPGSYTRKGRIERVTGTGTINLALASAEASTGSMIKATEVAV